MASASLSPPTSSPALNLQPHPNAPSSLPHVQRSSSAQPYDTPPLPPHNNFVRSSSHPASPPVARITSGDDYIAYRERPVEAVSQETTATTAAAAAECDTKKLESWSRKLKVTDFELMKTLGTGTFARVWLARFANPKNQDRNKVFALKVLKKVDVIKLKQVEHVRNERNVLSAVAGYPFITTLITSFSDDTSLYMLLDYTPGGEIFSYLRRARRFPLATVRFYAAEITLILAYLHDHVHVAYRDLKPENILLDADGHLKLVDFGFAKCLPPTPPGAPETSTSGIAGHHQGATGSSTTGPDAHGRGVTYTLCGTPEYLAPEVIRNQGHGMAVDWWALGILVYEMLIGQPPFWDANPMRIYEQILGGHIRFPSSSHSFHVSTTARQFILALCRTDPSQRLGYIAGGSARVMSHPFFEGVDWDLIYYKKVRGPIVPKVEWEGDSGNFDDYPDPPLGGEEGESEGGRGVYTEELRREFEVAFEDF